MLLWIFLKLAQLFPKKWHPFHASKNGVLDLNYSDFEYNHSQKLLELYNEHIMKNEWKWKKILDIGCGAGGKWVYIAEKYGSHVTGIDVSENFLQQAENFAIEKEVSDITNFFYRSALDTLFPDNSFDIIIMSDVLEHIPDTENLLVEALRVLKPGWRILFDFAPYYHYFWHHLWDTLPIPWLHLYTSESFRIALYKRSLIGLADKDKRIALRIWKIGNTEKISYLNKITIKKFNSIILKLDKNRDYRSLQIKYFMLKNMHFLYKIPLIREIAIRHIVGSIKK